ncbi:hypothetical protein Slin15195_G044410 [Septoria linicola]|uniref:Uncharacterized protein n=1 Tax=Septoria linicola TaxID=215465 RepID=A0A9Q9EIJ8_9PEZI|nr:hypothetical protein Slin14017_G047930 [Septoria linicola]USW51122.1 hypothetical protein Slin15195_G044410 [Septoria linicola]
MAPIQSATFFVSDTILWIGTLVSAILGFVVVTLLTTLLLYGTISLFDASAEGAEDRACAAFVGSVFHTFACGLAGLNIATFSDTHWALLVLKCLSVGIGTFVSGNLGVAGHTALPESKHLLMRNRW